MKALQIRLPAVLLVAMMIGTGCGTAASEGSETMRPMSADSAAELEAIYRARADSAQMRFTEADVRFMTRMITHHAQALEMARLAPSRSEDGQIRTLAARIINAQDDEIVTMQQWLRDRGQPVPEVSADVHGPDHTSMPGMVTPEQMRQLEQSRGAEFDRLFLTLMIQHHAGAITMVHELFATDGAAQDEEAFKIASDAQVDQATEIERMEQMLAERG